MRRQKVPRRGRRAAEAGGEPGLEHGPPVGLQQPLGLLDPEVGEGLHRCPPVHGPEATGEDRGARGDRRGQILERERLTEAGAHHLQHPPDEFPLGLEPAAREERKYSTRSGRGFRQLHVGRQKIPVDRTAATNRRS